MSCRADEIAKLDKKISDLRKYDKICNQRKEHLNNTTQIIYNVPLVKTQMKKIIVTAKTLYSHPKNVSKIYAALHTDLAW